MLVNCAFGSKNMSDEAKQEAAEQLGSFEDKNTSYLEYLEGVGAKRARMVPTGPSALQVQSDYLHELGNNHHPFDVLRRISLNPWVAPKDRISACKALLEYTAAKMPTKMEVSGAEGKPIELDTKALKNLSNAEIDQLIKLLDKANPIE